MTPEILVIFTADWCQSCKTLKGLLETPEFKHIEVQFIDADVNPEICREHNVRGLPTVISFDVEGAVLTRASGLDAVKYVNSLA